MARARRSTFRTRVWPIVAYGAIAVMALTNLASWRGDKPYRQDSRQPSRGRSGVGPSPESGHQRVHEVGRGRRATSPLQIPWNGWKDILLRTYAEVNDDRLLATAAGVVFYGLLAFFPAMTAFISIYGLFGDAGTVAEHLSLLEGLLPAGSFDIVREQITRVVDKGETGLGFASLFGLLITIWSANAGMKAILDGLNVVYDEREKRSFIWLNLISLALTLGSFIAILLAIGAVVVMPLILAYFEFGSTIEILLRVLRWPILLMLVVFGLAVLYRIGPSRNQARWQWLSVGSIAAAIAWLLGSALFSWYLANFADYDATYGSLGAAIGFMMWMWLSTSVVLLGAELNSEIEHQTAKDSTIGPEKPLGTRGATMADTVGEAKAT